MDNLTLDFVLGVASGLMASALLETFRYTRKVRDRKIRHDIGQSAPPPDDDFHCFQEGQISPPVTIICGSHSEFFSSQDVEINFSETYFSERPTTPYVFKSPLRNKLIRAALSRSGDAEYVDNDLVRLDSFDQGHELQNDSKGKLRINLSLAKFSDLLATNSATDASILAGITVRDRYSRKPYKDLARSILANTPGVEVVVISMSTFQQPNKQVLIRKRSEAVVGYRGRWQVSASGYMRPCHTDDNNVPSPFVTAAREATQELSDRLADSMSEYKMIGIGMHWHGLYPSFYGYIETGLTAKEIMGDACRDNYEGSISAIEFSPNAVLSHLSENPWTPMSCVAMIAALNVHFGPTGRAEIERIARSVRAVTPDSFRR